MSNVVVNREEVFQYLDDLRGSGETNMFGAGPCVEAKFNISRQTARDLVSKWMKTFDERHPE
jgi:hypothetical protein